MNLNLFKDDKMRVGDNVIYKNERAEIIEIRWGLYCIKFHDTNKQIWVSVDSLKRKDF